MGKQNITIVPLLGSTIEKNGITLYVPLVQELSRHKAIVEELAKHSTRRLCSIPGAYVDIPNDINTILVSIVQHLNRTTLKIYSSDKIVKAKVHFNTEDELSSIVRIADNLIGNKFRMTKLVKGFDKCRIKMERII